MKKLTAQVRKVLAEVLSVNSKGIAGALSGALAGFYAQAGISPEMTVETAVYTLISATLGFLVVWVSPANKTKRKR